MDGVVHATYVIARMHYTMERLLESGLLTDEEEREAADWIERNAQGYGEGLSWLSGYSCALSLRLVRQAKRPAVCFAKAHTQTSRDARREILNLDGGKHGGSRNRRTIGE